MSHLFILSIGLIFVGLPQLAITYLIFDSGDEMRYDYFYSNQQNGFYCLVGKSYTNTTYFSGDGFANQPKVIVSNFFYNFQREANNGFSFQITDITKTNFTTAIYCPYASRFYGFTFTWVAIDDERIEVINVFNQSMVGKATQTFLFDHFNKNVNQGFVSFIDFAFGGTINFDLKVKEVNHNQVAIDFTTANTNLLKLGYQIVLGTSQAFTTNSPITFSIPYSKSYDTDFIIIGSNQFLILPYTGINYQNSYNLRQLRNLTVTNSSGKQYTYSCWGAYSTVQLTYNKLWLQYEIKQVFRPFLCKKMRTLKQTSPYSQSNPQMILKINELSLTKSDTFSSNYYFLNNTYQTLNLEITYQCNLGQIIQGQILKCFKCDISYWNINQNCYRGHNQIIYYILLYQKDSVYQDITLNVNSRGFDITQKVQNQINSTETVITMKIIN